MPSSTRVVDFFFLLTLCLFFNHWQVLGLHGPFVNPFFRSRSWKILAEQEEGFWLSNSFIAKSYFFLRMTVGSSLHLLHELCVAQSCPHNSLSKVYGSARNISFGWNLVHFNISRAMLFFFVELQIKGVEPREGFSPFF